MAPDLVLLAVEVQPQEFGEAPLGARRTVDVEVLGPVVQPHGLDQCREAEEVVAVEVGDEHPFHLHE